MGMQLLIDTIIKRVNPKANTSKMVVSTNTKRQACVSTPLDAFMDFDRLWDELLDLSKHPPVQGMLKNSVLRTESESQFTVISTLDGKLLSSKDAGPKGKGKGLGEDIKVTNKYRVSKKRGELYRDAYRMPGGLVDKGWIIVYKNPLHIEAWTETPSHRLSSRDKAGAVQQIVDQVMASIT